MYIRIHISYILLYYSYLNIYIYKYVCVCVCVFVCVCVCVCVCVHHKLEKHLFFKLLFLYISGQIHITFMTTLTKKPFLSNIVLKMETRS